MKYIPNPFRYEDMQYRRCGESGIKLPLISLGLWQNFGKIDDYTNCRNIVPTAFDNGITHFDLANNYGPPPGAAEETFGKIYNEDLKPLRDELIISSKAGYKMWDGPYGDFGSKKYLVASLDQSLKRMGLDYVESGPLVRSSYHSDRHVHAGLGREAWKRAKELKALAAVKNN